MARHPCGICGVHVRESDEAIQCDGKCSLWHHRECLGMTLSVYIKLSKGQEDWVCRKCIKLKKIKQEVENTQRRRQKSPEDMGKTKMECKKLDFLNDTQKCVFCHTSDIDEMRYGPIYTHKNIITHYYCLLLSSNMEQNGRDCDGILGFLPGDINKEVRRGVRLYCTYCRSGGATLGCAIAKCKVVFHLPCGLRHGTLHQFYGEFKSYCAKHRPVQKISEKILAESGKGVVCGICYDKVVPRPIHDTLWAPCCQKNAFFHRDCVQKLATSAGYFFKCPLCNNVETFTQSMKEFGIYIPEQDASWESVPNAYQDLLVRHDTCDSTKCNCPSGRKTNVSGTRWELILCKMCGSKGIHIGCGRLKWRCPEFECDICNSTASREDSPGEEINNTGHTRNYNGNRHRLSGRTSSGEQQPSVSAERAVYDSSDSNDSTLITISNRRKLVKSPSPEYRSKTPPLSSRIPKKEKPDRTEKKPTGSSLVKSETDQKPNRSIIIDDSDDDIEYVGESRMNSSCLKTNNGATIPVVQINSSSSQKRLRVEGDVKVLPLEIVDFTIQVQGPTKKPKAVSPPRIKEVVINNPPNKPSTSATPAPVYTVPSTSYAPPPDMSRFVLVDPASLRPEDLPPGTLLYRSVQPVSTTPQQLLHPQPQPMPSSLPTTIPLQQLGSTSNADAQHSDLSEHRAGGGHYYSPLHPSHSIQKDIPSRALKHHCAGRRRRRPLKCDCNRLNPKVLLSPLKFTMANSGHIEILLPRRKLGFASVKRKVTPLPSRPMKKLKSTSKSVKKVSMCKKNTKEKSKKSCQKIKTVKDNKKIPIKKLKSTSKSVKNVSMCKKNTKEKSKKSCQKIKTVKDNKKISNFNKNLHQESTKSQNFVPLEISKKMSIEDYFCPIASGELNIKKTQSSTAKSRKRKIKVEENKEINITKKCKTLSSISPTDKTNHNTKKKRKIPFEDWKYKKMDFFLQKEKLPLESQPGVDCLETKITEEILSKNKESQVLLKSESDTPLQNGLLDINHANVDNLKECVIDEDLRDNVSKDPSVHFDTIMEKDLSCNDKEESSTGVESQFKEQDDITKFTTPEESLFHASTSSNLYKLLVSDKSLMEGDMVCKTKIINYSDIKGQDKDETAIPGLKTLSENLFGNATPDQDVFTKFTTPEELLYHASQDKLLVDAENLTERGVPCNDKIISSSGMKSQDKDKTFIPGLKTLSENLFGNATPDQDVFTKFTSPEELLYHASQDKLLVDAENLTERGVPCNEKTISFSDIERQDKDEPVYTEPKTSEHLLSNEISDKLLVDVNNKIDQNFLFYKNDTGIVIESQEEKIKDKHLIKPSEKKCFSLFPKIKFAGQQSKSKKVKKKEAKKPNTQTKPSINPINDINKKYEIKQYFTSEDLNRRESSSLKDTEVGHQMSGDELKHSPQKRPLFELQLNVISNIC